MVNPIKNFVKHSWFSFRDLFIPNYKTQRLDDSLVVLRLDAIGDYILFRNFLEFIRKSKKYKGFHITLIGNIIWKPIAEKLDSDWVDRFIWIDLKAFHKSLINRKKTLKEIEDTAYDVLLHPTYSRDYYVSEVIAKRVNAETKIASDGDLSNTTNWQKRLSDKTYDGLIKSAINEPFEFSKNTKIVSRFLDSPIDLVKPKIAKSNLESYPVSVSNYIVLFIGGGAEFRKWPATNWIALTEQLINRYTFDIIIAGGPMDKKNGLLIKEHFKASERVLNQCGETSIIQLVTLISNAEWMVSNETSAPHIAVSLDTPVLVISNGNHYGRFTPYPKSISPAYAVVYPPIIEKEKSIENLYKKYANGSDIPIDEVSVSAVLSKIKFLT